VKYIRLSFGVAVAVALVVHSGPARAYKCACLPPPADTATARRLLDHADAVVVATGETAPSTPTAVVPPPTVNAFAAIPVAAVVVDRSFKGPGPGARLVLDEDMCSYTLIDPGTRYLLLMSHVGDDEYSAAVCTSAPLSDPKASAFASAL